MKGPKYRYIFTGKLEPQNLINSFDLKSSVDLIQQDNNISGKLSLVASRSSLHVVFETDINHTDVNQANLETLKIYIQEVVEMIFNLYGYVNSLALDVYILNVTCAELDVDWNFGIKGEMNISKTHRQSKGEFEKLFGLFSKQSYPVLKNVFDDYHKAIKYPAMTAQFCFRALEIIRRNFFEDSKIKDADKRRENGWALLRKELGYKKEDFELIQTYGVPNRHGEYPPINYDTREKIMNFTRELIDTFIEKKLKEP